MSKVDVIRQKYPSLRDTTFASFVESDKTPTKKYLDRMCYYWTNKGRGKLYQSNLIKAIENFDKLLPYIKNKDIYSKEYDNFNSLIGVINEAEVISFEKNFKREDNVEVIFEDDRYLILKPLTFKGSQKYGANTKWCVSGARYESTYKSYIKTNHLIFVIDKQNKNSATNKMAILWPYTSNIESFVNEMPAVYNASDTIVGFKWFLNNGWGEEDIVKIITHIRFYCYRTDKYRKIKNEVEQTIDMISKIDFDSLTNKIQKLRDSKVFSEETIEKNKQIIDDFISKLNNITINL